MEKSKGTGIQGYKYRRRQQNGANKAQTADRPQRTRTKQTIKDIEMYEVQVIKNKTNNKTDIICGD